jgi:xanthine dehydrogenase YagS FAD-binding subunit
MRAFTYERPNDVAAAVRAAGQPGARLIAGGTNLLDLMKVDVERPRHLVDVSRLPLRGVDETADGGLAIGAMVSNAELAADDRVRQRYPMLSLALLNGASAQLRNQATTAGNLLQRTRCPYFYDVSKPCNKRASGSGCSALQGYNRMHAVLGVAEDGKDSCIAVHPSDMAVAMTALHAEVEVQTADGATRKVPVSDLHRLPGTSPENDTTLKAGELITSVILPPPPAGRQVYRKVRDRASFAFALVSVAALLDVADGKVREARLVLGGVAHKPWPARAAETALVGASAGDEAFDAAATASMKGAVGRKHNEFKIDLAKRTVAGALGDLAKAGG